MISAQLGQKHLLRGIAKHLEKHAYGNARNEDLWVALREVSGQDVDKLISTWTARVGLPVVTVTAREPG